MHNESHTAESEQVLKDTLEAFYQVPTFVYSYKRETNQLHRTNLVTGERSSLRTPSTMAAVGVKCLEEAYSSLAD
jgi:hypothetical protein